MRLVVLGAATVALTAAAPAAPKNVNERAVRDFYEAGLNQKDFARASRFLGPVYIQHNPRAPDGVDGFRALVELLKAKVPQFHCDLVRLFSDGDYVIMHNRCSPAPGGPQNAVVDIFRLDKGKIVEHWDVSQPVPAQAANSNSMF